MWVCTIFLVLMTKMTLVSLFLKLNNKLVSGLLILNSLKCIVLVEYYITASSVGERLWDHFNYSRNKPTVDYLCISFANGNGNFPSTRMNINKSFVVIIISAKISFFLIFCLSQEHISCIPLTASHVARWWSIASFELSSLYHYWFSCKDVAVSSSFEFSRVLCVIWRPSLQKELVAVFIGFVLVIQRKICSAC